MFWENILLHLTSDRKVFTCYDEISGTTDKSVSYELQNLFCTLLLLEMISFGKCVRVSVGSVC